MDSKSRFHNKIKLIYSLCQIVNFTICETKINFLQFADFTDYL